MKTVQSKGAGSQKLPRGRASRLRRARERSRLACRTSGKAQAEALAPGCSLSSLFPPSPHSLYSPGAPCLLRRSSIYLPIFIPTRQRLKYELFPEPLASAFCSGSLLRASIPSHTRPPPSDFMSPRSSRAQESGPSNGAPGKGWSKLVLERQKAGSLKNSEKWRLCALESTGEALDKSRDSVWRPVLGMRTVS